MPKKNLFLDYGGLITNYDFNKETLQRAHKLALVYINSLGSPEISPQSLETAHNKATETYIYTREKDNSEWTMNQIMGLMVLNLGIKADLQQLEDIYKFNDHNSILFPNSKRILMDLSKNYKLGIISNLPHDSLISELKKESMLNMFDPIVISCQVGYRKPHPAIYQEAMRRANARSEKCIFASHDEQEIIGADRVGMKGILAKSLEEVIGAL
ncbi:MAG: HAD family hydrolase [Candidatus Nanoarchaeia archaeon]|nr:HAD family hydrolase [Candidatus Nanoarchaeia archaeon]MDD5741512.1 HAD family hydrolase [Candidatus Nanoarchaeia archaeon]